MAHTPEDLVTYALQGGVADVRLNRPDRLNAASPELVRHLKQALERAHNEGASVVILSGEGRAFCAGHDLKADMLPPESLEARQSLENLQDVTKLLRAASIVSVAAVQGYAFGAGLEFALSCDFIIAEQETVFGFPEVSVGLSVTGGISYLLPQAIGLPRAKELVLLGDRFDAAKAHSLGLVTAVVPAGQSRTEADALAHRLTALPRAALTMAKEAFESGVRADMEAAMAVEIANGLRTAKSEDAEFARAQFEAKGAAQK